MNKLTIALILCALMSGCVSRAKYNSYVKESFSIGYMNGWIEGTMAAKYCEQDPFPSICIELEYERRFKDKFGREFWRIGVLAWPN